MYVKSIGVSRVAPGADGAILLYNSTRSAARRTGTIVPPVAKYILIDWERVVIIRGEKADYFIKSR